MLIEAMCRFSYDQQLVSRRNRNEFLKKKKKENNEDRNFLLKPRTKVHQSFGFLIGPGIALLLRKGHRYVFLLINKVAAS